MALKLGIQDPEQWRESVPERVLALWEAYDAIEPIGCEWERHASVMAMLDAIIAAIVNPNLEKKDRLQPRLPSEFMPREMTNEPKKSKPKLKHQLALVARVFGGK